MFPSGDTHRSLLSRPETRASLSVARPLIYESIVEGTSETRFATWRKLFGPDAEEISRDWDYSTTKTWCHMFYLLTPITHRESLSRLHTRLALVDLGVIPVERIAERGIRGLMSCSCPCFLHYAWCKHSCADAFRKGIISNYPPNKDPNVMQSAKVGRPPVSKKQGGGRWC